MISGHAKQSTRVRRAKPYFGPRMAARQGDIMRKAYLALLVEYLAKAGDLSEINVLEVGSWAGASTVTWARAIKDLGLAGRVLCIDFWRPYLDLNVNKDEVYQEMTRVAEDGRIFDLFLDNISACKVDDIIDYTVGDSKKVLPSLEHDRFQIVFIDASHQYGDVVADIRNALPLVADGGIFCGDDFELSIEEVSPEAHRQALGSGADYVRDPSTGTEYHPGVTQAVHEIFGKVSSWHGIWGVRRSGSTWLEVDLTGFTPRIPEHLLASERDEHKTAPILLAAYRGYNLVAHNRHVYALRQDIGEVNVAEGPTELQRRYSQGAVIIAQTAEEARARVDAIEFARLAQKLEERLGVLESAVAAQAAIVERLIKLEYKIEAAKKKLSQ